MSSAMPAHKDHHNYLLPVFTLSEKRHSEGGHAFWKGVVELAPNYKILQHKILVKTFIYLFLEIKKS